MNGMAEAISGLDCKVQEDGVRQEDEHLPESAVRVVSENHWKTTNTIRLRWADTDKNGGIGEPLVRSRLCGDGVPQKELRSPNTHR